MPSGTDRPDPSYRAFAFGYCSCKQDTNERYWGEQLKRHFGPTDREITGPVEVDHFQSWSRILRSDQTEMVFSIFDVPTEISGILG